MEREIAGCMGSNDGTIEERGFGDFGAATVGGPVVALIVGAE